MDQDHNPGQPIDSDQETVSVFDFDMLPSDEEYIPNYIEGGSSNYEDFYTDITDTSSLDSDGEIDVWMSADRHIDRTVGNETEPIDVDDEEECEDPMHLAEDEEFEDEDEAEDDEDDEDYDGEDEMSIDLAVSTSSDSDGESYDTDVTSDEDAAAQLDPDDQPPQVFIKPPVYFSPKFTIHLPEECVVLLLTGTSADQEPPRSFKVAMARRQQYSVHSSSGTSIINQSISDSNVAIPPELVELIAQFVHMNGVSQENRITELNIKYATFESRIDSFKTCRKNLRLKLNAFCETGLYYYGYGLDDEMKCYCCDVTLQDWKYKVNPWVLHAIHSPGCNHLLLSKSRNFVDAVHTRYNKLRTCGSSYFKEKFFNLFTEHDWRYIDKSLGTGDRLSRKKCIDQVVSALVVIEVPYCLSSSYVIESHRRPYHNDVLCKICFKEKIEILFIPCGHVFTCVQCAVTITECSICREPFNASTYAMKIYMEDKFYNTQAEAESSISDSSNSTPLCRTCNLAPIGVAFVPCLHVHNCFQCAITLNECPVCDMTFCGLIQVFL